MLRDRTRASDLFVHRAVRLARGIRSREPVRPRRPTRRAHALLLVAAHAVLEPIRGELDRGTRVGMRLGDDQVVLVRTQRDLGGVELALLGHYEAHLVNAIVVARELLETLLGERPDVGTDVAVASGHLDLHVASSRAAWGRRARDTL